MHSTSARKKAAKVAIDRTVRNAFELVTDRGDETRAAFGRLLRQVRYRSDLLRPPMTSGRYDSLAYADVLSGLLSMAACSPQWLRPVETWSPTGGNPRPQFSSLVRHLLTAYPVPAFLTSVWFDGSTIEARSRQGWFIHIGSGQNIRNADLPLAYTKRMAHHFLQAPDHFKVEPALRWGQVRGLGGSERLAHAVIATRLGRSFESEDFWSTVVQFLVNHPELDSAQIEPIIEYLHDQRFVPQSFFDDADGEGEWRPPQPDLSMKGRTSKALWRQVVEWQKARGMQGKKPSLRWSRSEIGEFRLPESGTAGGPGRVWMIRELLTSRELRTEGNAMHHCVAGFVGLCLRRRASIWSMTVEDGEGRRRVLTIEVDPKTKEVVQASRCCNAEPRPKDREILGIWAERQRLKVEC